MLLSQVLSADPACQGNGVWGLCFPFYFFHSLLPVSSIPGSGVGPGGVWASIYHLRDPPSPPSLVPPGLLRTACLGQGNRSMVTDASPRAPWGRMVDPCEPKATKMTPKWKPQGVVGGVKNVSVSISAKKCRPLRNIIIYYVSSRFALLYHHHFLCMFDTKNTQTIDKTQYPTKTHEINTVLRLFLGQGLNSIEIFRPTWSPVWPGGAPKSE